MSVQLQLSGKRPTWAEIDLQALASNFLLIRKSLPPPIRIIAVVKANAYGHGAVMVSRRLQDLGADYLAVAFLEEGLELRAAGIHLPVLLLNGFWEGQQEEVLQAGLTPMAWNLSMAKSLGTAAERVRRKARIHFKIDTGMSRLGANSDETILELKECRNLPWIEVEGICTHLASSEATGNPATLSQIECFSNIKEQLALQGTTFPWNHAANSAAVLGWPESWFDSVRPGLVLYGINPLDEGASALKPVLSWKTRIMQIRKVKKGTMVGYGGTYTVKKDSLLATLPVGYADGLNRLLSNRGLVLLRGQRVPVVGSISMDLSVIDVTDVGTAQVGDEVVLIGKQGRDEIGAKEMSILTQTIPYEVLTGISQRVPRIYT